MKCLKCPKCGNDWIADNALIGVEHRKHWWDIVPTLEPYHTVYPKEPRYECIFCKHKWGIWEQ